jgi:membrane protease subunit HflK
LIAQVAANDAATGSARSGPVQQQQNQQEHATTPSQEVLQTIEQVRQRDSRSRDSSRDRESR